MNQMCDEYEMFKDRSIIADCLRDLGFKEIVGKVMTANGKTLKTYLSIIQKVAQQKNNMDVLDRLYFAGLIYG